MPVPDLFRPTRNATRSAIAVALTLAYFNGAMPVIAAESARKEPPPMTQAEFTRRLESVVQQINELSPHVAAISSDGKIFFSPLQCGHPTIPTALPPSAPRREDFHIEGAPPPAAAAKQLTITAIQDLMLRGGWTIKQIAC